MEQTRDTTMGGFIKEYPEKTSLSASIEYGEASATLSASDTSASDIILVATLMIGLVAIVYIFKRFSNGKTN